MQKEPSEFTMQNAYSAYAKLRTRRSCRSFADKPIDDALLQEIILTGLSAPTGGNLQPFSLIVVKDAAKKAVLAEVCGQGFIAKAAANLVFVMDWHKLSAYTRAKKAPFVANRVLNHNIIAYADIICAAQLIEAAATMAGIGVCMVGNIMGSGERVGNLLKLPENTYPLLMLSLGYPANITDKRAPKLPADVIVFEEEYPVFDEETLLAAYDKKYSGMIAPLPQDDAKREETLAALRESYLTTYTAEETETILSEIEAAGVMNEMQRRFGIHYGAAGMLKKQEAFFSDMARRNIIFGPTAERKE